MIDSIIKKSYVNWILQNVPEGEDFGNCTLWSRVMQQAFPELIRVEGNVYGKMFMEGGTREHYHEYLITSDGYIVDPTAGQFDFMFGKGKWSYEPITDGRDTDEDWFNNAIKELDSLKI